eukprot:gene5577-9393_t
MSEVKEEKIEIQPEVKKRDLSPDSKSKNSKNKKQKKERVNKYSYLTSDEMKNELFDKFYQQQNIMDKEEWDTFLNTMKETLPITFRINTTNEIFGKKLSNIFIQKAKEFENLEIDGKKIQPYALPWYPEENCGWHLEVTKSDLRKNPLLKSYKLLLQSEHDQGGITRQEAVSMLPPLFMDVKSHHKILDMCAAPGSKTCQLLEMLYKDTKSGEEPTGFVIANDNDQKRAYLLIHSMARVSQLSKNFIVTNHDATMYPSLAVNDKILKFDRILCDVMCSGDGTIRKSPDVWKKWKPTLGYSLHKMQIKVTIRAAKLLEVGGKMVYSTCSINPIEDEATVAQVLRMSKGSLELVDVSKTLDNLKYKKGLTTWKILDKKAEEIDITDDAVKKKHLEYIDQSCYPPTEEEIKTMHLDRCMRFLPHLMNTGGFFVAVLQKVKEMPNEDKSKESNQVEKIIKNPGKSAGEEFFQSVNPTLLDTIFEFYGIKGMPKEWFFVKSEDSNSAKKLYYATKEIVEIMDSNEKQKRWKVLNMGLRVFEHINGDYKMPYRFSQEACHLLLKHLSPDRIISLNKKDLLNFIDSTFVRPQEFSDESVQQKVKDLPTGSVIFVSPDYEGIALCGMKQRTVVMKYAKKEYLESIKQRIEFE